MKLSHFVLLCREWRGGTQLHYKCWKAFTIIFYLEIAKTSLFDFHHCALHMKCSHLPDLLQTYAEMKEIEHLALFAPSRVHICMINDCSPQHFTLAHFTDGLADKKLCPSAVCSGGKKWDLWPLCCLTVVFKTAHCPILERAVVHNCGQSGNTEANFMELYVWLWLRIFTEESFGAE